MSRNQRSPEAREWHKLYGLKQWTAARRAQLSRQPLCELCKQQGRIVPATVVNHIKPHKGDWQLFSDPGNLQSVCQPCHDGAVQSYERTGRMRGCDINGHPLSKTPTTDRTGLGAMAHPAWFKPVHSPLTIVCGPPASGKSTYVAKHMRPCDLIIDLDVIAHKAFGKPARLVTPDQRLDCLRSRNDRLGSMMRAGESFPRMTWLIVTEPTAKARQWWDDTVKPRSIIVMATPHEQCMANAAKDLDQDKRQGPDVEQSIANWWADYTPREGDVVVNQS